MCADEGNHGHVTFYHNRYFMFILLGFPLKKREIYRSGGRLLVNVEMRRILKGKIVLIFTIISCWRPIFSTVMYPFIKLGPFFETYFHFKSTDEKGVILFYPIY